MRDLLSLGRYLKVAFIFLALAAFSLAIVAQEKPKVDETKPAAQKPDQAKPAVKSGEYTLSVKTKPIVSISLKAEKAKLTDIAAELARRLKTEVFVSPKLENEVVSLEFSGLTLEPAMQLMSPATYIDYEIDTSSGMPPKALGIYLYDTTTGEPPISAVVKSTSQSLLVEGDTEEGIEPRTEADKQRLEEQPLKIQFQNNSLSVKAKKQPLSLVLLKIGEELGIPVDIQYEAPDVIDTEISKLSVEDTIRKLSPNIRLFLRADLLHAERRALRLVLADPAKAAQQGQ
ncbi:MAG TPA: hypothetical protein VI306_13220 [Pyrinomonadaceae bacterium]